MKIIIYILLFLLIISIVNNYVLHYYTKKKKVDKKNKDYLVNPSKLPDNIGILSLYVFYNKDEKYDKCHESDILFNKNSNNEPKFLINMKRIISEIYNKNNDNCYIIKKTINQNVNLNKYLDKAIEKIA